MAYTNDFPAERPAIISHRRPPSDWPSQGAITMQKLVVTHRADLPPVLKGLDLEIRGHEKVSSNLFSQETSAGCQKNGVSKYGD